MTEPTATNPNADLMRDIQIWWQGTHDLWTHADRLDQLEPRQITNLARDAGISVDDLKALVMQTDGPLVLLKRRLDNLHLTEEEIAAISKDLLADLKRTCALCESKERCADDFAEDPSTPGWESYCPNSGTLRLLK